MKLLFRTFLLLSFLFLWNCQRDDTSVEIRVKNGGMTEMKNIMVNPMSCAGLNTQVEDYGKLGGLKYSEYKTIEAAYEEMAVSIDVDDVTYTYLPSNCSGFPTLSPGKYTLELYPATTGTGQHTVAVNILKDN